MILPDSVPVIMTPLMITPLSDSEPAAFWFEVGTAG